MGGNLTITPEETFFHAGPGFSVQLSQATFFEGDMVSGQTTFNLNRACGNLTFTVKVHGFERILWTESRGSGKNR